MLLRCSLSARFFSLCLSLCLSLCRRTLIQTGTHGKYGRTHTSTHTVARSPSRRRDVACAGVSDLPNTGEASRSGQGWRAGSRSGRDAFSPTPSCRRRYYHLHHHHDRHHHRNKLRRRRRRCRHTDGRFLSRQVKAGRRGGNERKCLFFPFLPYLYVLSHISM